jgi:holliday junction DNA helicase RuvA
MGEQGGDMIARLRGQVLEKDPSGVVIEAGGVGYAVSVPLSCLEKLQGNDADLFVHTVVREDAILLFGFLTRQERELFRKLISVNGVGPSTALAVLSGMSADDLVRAVRERDHRRLQGIPRVGKKTAERICLELSEKFEEATLAAGGGPALSDDLQDAVSALANLGYKVQDASTALRKVRETHPEGPVSSWIRMALRELSPR